MSSLTDKKCKPCEGGVKPLSADEADRMLSELDGWARTGSEIEKTFEFRNYYQTMAFVNASAYISHQEDHHPDLLVGYKTCRVIYTTHAIGGLSENDFICAAKLDALIHP
ncbi:4a-hydroxytetrahydrobiopterin dehydratase [Pontiellaceae bacterium B12219]|nr:4a-hydroxytetrahydrobiopterin dehydratase [Pontiellaceae bacterium B12219]